MASSDAPRKVAVIGSGLAGLTAAWLLQQQAAQGVDVAVHVFERAPLLGFHSSSLVVPFEEAPSTAEKPAGANGHAPRSWIVDVPMRSLQGGYYTRLIALYRKLGIALAPTYYTYSFSHLVEGAKRPRTHFLHQGRSGLSSFALPAAGGLAGKVTGVLRLLQYALCYLYLLALAGAHRWTGAPAGPLKAWTRATARGRPGCPAWVASCWEQFVREMLYTLFGAVLTCSDQQLDDVDAGLMLDYIWLTVLTPHYSVPTSSASVAQALITPLPPAHVHLSTTITSIRRADGLYTIAAASTAGGGGALEMGGFTDVVLATQANQAKAILETVALDDGAAAGADGVAELLRCLGTFRYVPTIVVNHRDTSVLPGAHEDQRDLNLVRCPSPPPASASEKESQAPASADHFAPAPGATVTMATHVLRCPADGQPAVLQTTNPIVALDPAKVLSVAKLERALPTAESTASLGRLHELQGTAGLWLVGAYAWQGIPLLEGCVASAEQVVLGPRGILGGRTRPAPAP